jgi:hypothetical protein
MVADFLLELEDKYGADVREIKKYQEDQLLLGTELLMDAQQEEDH